MRVEFKKILLVILLFLIPGSGWAGNNIHQPFFSALQKALESNPSILAARDQLRVQQEKLGLVKVDMLPELSLGMSAKHSHTSWQGGGSNSNPASFSLSLSQPIIDFSKVKSLEKAPLPVKKAEMSLLLAAENVFFQLVQETINILQAQAVYERSQQNLQLTKEHLRATNLRFEAGELTQTDISQAESRVASIEAELISTKNQIRMSMARFEEIAGANVPRNLTILPILPSVLKMLKEAPIDSVQLRPDVVVALIELEEAQKNIEFQNSSRLPVVTFNTDASRTWNKGSSSQPGANDSVNFSIDLSIPLDARGKFSRKGRQATWERDEKRAKLDTVRQQAVREVKHALLGIESARAKHRALQQVEISARFALRGVEKEFTVGTRSSPDLLDAQNDLFSAQRDLVESHYSLVLEHYKLLKAKGQLTISKPVFDFNTMSKPIFAQSPLPTLATAGRGQAYANSSNPLFDLDLDIVGEQNSTAAADLQNRAALADSFIKKPEAVNGFAQADNRQTPSARLNPAQNPLPPVAVASGAVPQPQSNGGGRSQEQMKRPSAYAVSGIQAIPPTQSGFVVRVATFPKRDAAVAEHLAQRLVADNFAVIKIAEKINGHDFINLLAGPFASEKEALITKRILETSYRARPLIALWNPPGAQKPTPVAKQDMPASPQQQPSMIPFKVAVVEPQADQEPIQTLPLMLKPGVLEAENKKNQLSSAARFMARNSVQDGVDKEVVNTTKIATNINKEISKQTLLPSRNKERVLMTKSGVRIGVVK